MKYAPLHPLDFGNMYSYGGILYDEGYYSFYDCKHEDFNTDPCIGGRGSRTQEYLSLKLNNHINFFQYGTIHESTKYVRDLSRLNMIKDCSYLGQVGRKEDCEKYFYQVPTFLGICSTFNALEFDHAFKENVHSSAFKRMFNVPKGEVVKNKGYGYKNGMTLLLDSHQSDKLLVEDYVKDRLMSFTLSINSEENFSDTISSSFQAHTGKKTIVTIQPFLEDAATDLKDTDFNTRGCLFKTMTWNSNSNYKIYSNKICQFECSVERATKILKCVPWNIFPLQNNPDIRVCNGSAAKEFRHKMQEIGKCNCPDDCQMLSFDYKTDTQPILPEKECTNTAYVRAAYSAVNLQADNYAYVVQGTHKSNTFSYLPETRCLEKMKNDFAIVQFIIEKPVMIKTLKTKSTNILQKFEVIGKFIFFLTADPRGIT